MVGERRERVRSYLSWRVEPSGRALVLLFLSVLVMAVVAMVADGMTQDEILREHPDLEAADIGEALHYVALAVQERELPLRLPA